jgi:hypothetical protein
MFPVFPFRDPDSFSGPIQPIPGIPGLVAVTSNLLPGVRVENTVFRVENSMLEIENFLLEIENYKFGKKNLC